MHLLLRHAKCYQDTQLPEQLGVAPDSILSFSIIPTPNSPRVLLQVLCLTLSASNIRDITLMTPMIQPKTPLLLVFRIFLTFLEACFGGY